jgi:hypothetical protein
MTPVGRQLTFFVSIGFAIFRRREIGDLQGL